MSDNIQKKAASMDSIMARAVVDQKLATQAEVEQCLSLAGGDEQGDTRPLEEVLVEQNVVTAAQIQRVRKTIEESGTQQIPGYVILGRIGSGAMATVFKARQISLDRIVAIKVLPKRFSENPEYVEMFYREGMAAARLNHPNIVQAIDVGESGGYHYFVMEYVEGHTVYEEIASGKVFTETEACEICVQVARALDHAHRRGLIHRDVKPKNIILTTDGRAKLADMGLARLATDTASAEAEAGRAFGTPYYISPEQIRGARNVDFRADIYSLGATLFHMVTGRLPFEADTPVGVMQKHLKEPLTPPDHINQKLSSGIGEVVEKMMAKNPDDRYAATEDVLGDLEAISQGKPPLQARRRLSPEVLSGLASGQGQQREPYREPGIHSGQTNWLPLMILLVAALVISLALNIYQAVMR
jgi:serine/threonine-protein kinase